MNEELPKTKIAILDYGMGNIRSVQNAFARLGCSVILTQEPAELNDADALVLPGVGAFGEAMDNLRQLKLIRPIQDAVDAGKPMLGICLGMQLLAESSEERGTYEGLSLIPGTVKLIRTDGKLRLPHVGWNTVQISKDTPLFRQENDGDTFYFVHSYQVNCAPEFVTATSNYGGDLVAAVQKDRVFGVQFHPERSQGTGLRLMDSFVQFVVGSHEKVASKC
jgi:glutamine amidotransferase